MKNIIKNIAIVLVSLVSQVSNAQELQYNNVKYSSIDSLLENNNIFYVGILDRKLLSEGKEGFVHKDISDLQKFDSIYNNVDFKTNPDTNYVIMYEYEMYDNKRFDSEGLSMALKMSRDNSVVVGMKKFKTPNSDVFDEVILYEVVIRGQYLPEFTLNVLGLKKDGSYTRVW
jgi:hypothetical protein